MSSSEIAPKSLQMNRYNDTEGESHISATLHSSLVKDLKVTEQPTMLEPATVIYHESAHSIVFRDNLRRAHEKAAIKRREADRVQAMTSTPTRGRSKYLDSREEDVAGKNESAQSRASSRSSASASRSVTSRSTKLSTHSKPSTTRNVKPETCSTSDYSNHSDLKDHESSNAVVDGEIHLDEDNQSDASSSTSTSDDSHEASHDFFMEGLSISRPQKKKRNKKKSTEAGEKSDIPTPNVVVANFTPIIDPLPLLDLGPHDEFTELLHSAPFVVDESQQSKGGEKAKPNPEVWETMTRAEKDVVTKLQQGKCVAKTVKNSAWNSFLHKFPVKDGEICGGRWRLNCGENASLSKNRIKHIRFPQEQPSEMLSFHSFATSTTLLPSCGFKMRCYGSIKEHTTGVLFALPINDNNDESQTAHQSKTWCWPSGYSAKTEFNIDNKGNLINGRADALVSLDELRIHNYSYLHDKNYKILGKTLALKTVPFNEIYLRVGGTVGAHDSDRSFNDGVGLPIALFSRSLTYGDLTSLFRLRARLSSVLGRDHVHGIPLLFITPETGVRVLTEELQKKLLLVMSNSLNPFQNPQLKHHTNINNTSEKYLEQKLQELLDLDDDGIREILTPEECARVAGGFGATDDSVANLLMEAVLDDVEHDRSTDSSTFDGHTKLHQGRLQDLVNEGLTAAVRSGDYNTSRQLLILYTLVASKGQQEKNRAQSITLDGKKAVGDITGAQGYLLSDTERIEDALGGKLPTGEHISDATMKREKEALVPTIDQENSILHSQSVPPPPPPPPLDTDRLRSATNSDGLLAVLGAAQVLKSMQDGNGKLRTLEAVAAIEEWIDKSENSVSFRVASWRQLRAAQGDLKIATEQDSNFMAFISNKAIDTRKKFAKELKNSVSNTKFESIDFLKSIHAILSKMNNPCLRLELLQFILGLDNRYSIAHVIRSVELAATCLNISAYETMRTESEYALTLSANG